MGQYFVVINMTKRKQMNCLSSLGGSTVSFDRFTSGCKLAEQLHNLGVKPFLMLSLVGTGFSESALPIGTWAGDRVVIIGDYSDDPDFLTEDEKKELTEKSTTLYSLADDWEDVSADRKQWFDAAKKMGEVAPPDGHHVFMNMDLKEYIDPVSFGSPKHVDNFALEQDGISKALFSTLFYSTGAGGGDISELKDGRWAGNRIKLVDIQEAQALECIDVSEDVKDLLDAVADL